MRQTTYLATLKHLKEILLNKAEGLNFPSSSLKKKTCLTAQINSIFLPDQRIPLEELLTDWLVHKARNNFKANLYNAGKTLFDPKCYVNLKVQQADLDQHESSSLIDIKYNVPLPNLEGLPEKIPLLKPFPTNYFPFENFFQILSTQ